MAVPENPEKPRGERNLAEFILNGKTLNGIENMKFQDADGEWKPLAKGHIPIQAEWAELEYRTVRVKEIVG